MARRSKRRRGRSRRRSRGRGRGGMFRRIFSTLKSPWFWGVAVSAGIAVAAFWPKGIDFLSSTGAKLKNMIDKNKG